MPPERSCLSAEEIARYTTGGAASDHAALQAHVERCEPCRRGIAATVRASRREAVTPPAPEAAAEHATATVAGLTELGQRVAHHSATANAQEYTLATLRDEEIRSARTLIRMGRALGVVALLPMLFLGGNLAVQIGFASAVAIAIVVGVIVERRIRAPERYTERAMMTLALLIVGAGLFAMLYYGIFSAAQLFPVLTIYVFSRRERFGNTLAIFLINAIGQAVIAAIVISRVVPDPGLFEPSVSIGFQIVGHALIQIGDLAAFVVGWLSRRDTQAAIENLQRAMVLAARREALLQEAREELDRAMRLGGAGRYTDHTFGAYRLGNVLGRGGMGEVYEAVHVETDEPAAVKLLAPRELANPRSVERFVREVRAVSALTSPHVVRVLGASDEHDPIPYLVMERLYGQTLAQLLRSAPTPEELLRMLAQVGTAVEEAWDRGIVHRDLKPHNLFLAELPGGATWKVLDFGVAALGDHGGTLTEGHIIGTPAYMAPEQARGERVDYRADVYALSAIAYRWLTGRPVTSGTDLRATLFQVVNVTPARPSAIAELDPDIDCVLAIGLAKDPADRWSRVSELRAALADALASRLDPQLRERAAQLVAAHPWATPRV